jgi:hypothetical protein
LGEQDGFEYLNDMKNKLLCLLLAVIVFDFGVTLVGQPSSYWSDPHTAREANSLFAWFMVRGIAWYLALILVYVASVGALLKILPRRGAIVTSRLPAVALFRGLHLAHVTVQLRYDRADSLCCCVVDCLSLDLAARVAERMHCSKRCLTNHRLPALRGSNHVILNADLSNIWLFNMRKFTSVVFGIVFLFSLPGLTKAFRGNSDPAVLTGVCLFSLVLLMLAVYFWRSGKREED